jgi:hypothetical protein
MATNSIPKPQHNAIISSAGEHCQEYYYEKSATDLSTLADLSKQNAELCHIAESAHVAAARESGSGFPEMVVDRLFEMPASLEK